METMSNAEKQARFRKKEELRKLVEFYFRQWQGTNIHHRFQPQHVLKLLSDAAELPSGWTDEHWERAKEKLGQLLSDLKGSPNQIQQDMYEALNVEYEFMTTPDPGKWMDDIRTKVNDAHSLAAYLISSLELSRCDDVSKAAALMEVFRHVGRSISNLPDVPKSNATTVCLATLPLQYSRPEWFAPKLARWLSSQLDEKLVRELGKQLLDVVDRKRSNR